MANDISNTSFLDFPIYPMIEAEKLLPKCKGKNQKNTLVVINQSIENTTELEFLKKILGAAKLDFENDILLLNITKKEPFSFIRFQTIGEDTFGKIDKVLVFGFPHKYLGLNLDIKNYNVHHFSDCKYLFADALGNLSQNKNLKGALWQGMQSMFL